MKNNIFLLIVSTVLVFACEQSKKVTDKKVMESLQNEDAKKNWEKVANEKVVSDLSDLSRDSKHLVSQREKEVFSKEEPQTSVQIPKFNENQVAGVEVRSSAEISSYAGAFDVLSTDNNLIAGKINDNIDFDIYYKLPKSGLTNFVKAKSQLSLFYENQIVSGSFNQALFLMDKKNPLLITIEEGSEELFQKEFKISSLTVKQVLDEKNQTSPVEITFYGQKFRISPGESLIRKTAYGNVEFYLMTSYAKPKTIMEEGLNHYIRLYAYLL